MASAAELESILCDLHAKVRDNMGTLPVEEKKKLLEVFQAVADKTGAIQKDLQQSVNSTDHEGKILKMCGQFPRDNAGSMMIPTKEDLTVAVNLFGQNRRTIPPLTVPVQVQSVSKEENFYFLSTGPTSPNYLHSAPEVFIVMENLEQARYVLELCSHGSSIMVKCGCLRDGEARGCFQFTTPTQDTRTRATYREIGTLLTRLKKVDDTLKELGAVPGSGGIPKLSDTLIQYEDFDASVTRFQGNPEYKVHLHSFLCTRTRVDRHKRQAALEPLVDERIEILLKLSKFDPVEFPFVMKREFK